MNYEQQLRVLLEGAVKKEKELKAAKKPTKVKEVSTLTATKPKKVPVKQEKPQDTNEEIQDLGELKKTTLTRYKHFATQNAKKHDDDAVMKSHRAGDDEAGEEDRKKRNKREKGITLADKKLKKADIPKGSVIKAKAPELFKKDKKTPVKESQDLSNILKLAGLKPLNG